MNVIVKVPDPDFEAVRRLILSDTRPRRIKRTRPAWCLVDRARSGPQSMNAKAPKATTVIAAT
jgi:hypothetical protein